MSTAVKKTQPKRSIYGNNKATLFKPCAILVGNSFLGGKELGLATSIGTTLMTWNAEPIGVSWAGVRLLFPFSKKMEEEGFGVCHQVSKPGSPFNHVIQPVDHLKLEIKFPLDGMTVTAKQLPQELRKRLPPTDKQMSQLDVALRNGAHVRVSGFGKPFYNPGHVTESWIEGTQPIVENLTLLDLFQQRSFTFIVAAPDQVLHHKWSKDALPAPGRYPYGTQHDWDLGRYSNLISKNKGSRFPPAWRFEEDNEHVAALVHSRAQDVVWLHTAARKIADDIVHAYFVPRGDSSVEYYAVIPIGQEYLAKYEAVWKKLIDMDSVSLILNSSLPRGEDGFWNAKIVSDPRKVPHLDDHPIGEYELILHVRRPPPHQISRAPGFKVVTFPNRSAANAAFKHDKNK